MKNKTSKNKNTRRKPFPLRKKRIEKSSFTKNKVKNLELTDIRYQFLDGREQLLASTIYNCYYTWPESIVIKGIEYRFKNQDLNNTAIYIRIYHVEKCVFPPDLSEISRIASYWPKDPSLVYIPSKSHATP